jgi:hypothetical protein
MKVAEELSKLDYDYAQEPAFSLDLILDSIQTAQGTPRSVRDFARKEWPFGQFG